MCILKCNVIFVYYFCIINFCNFVYFNEFSEILVWVKENIEDLVLVVD